MGWVDLGWAGLGRPQTSGLADWLAGKALKALNAESTVKDLEALKAKSIVKAGWLAGWLAGKALNALMAESNVKALKALKAKSVVKAGWLAGWQGP